MTLCLSSFLVKDLRDVREELTLNTKTDAVLKEIEQRVGHQVFSENVKKNFQYKCCYPTCEVEGRGFIVSGHIARWADEKTLRGRTDNGLCLCLIHDKAFELGFFTLNEDKKIQILDHKMSPEWLADVLNKGRNLEIKPRQIDPSSESLRSHWRRIGYDNATSEPTI